MITMEMESDSNTDELSSDDDYDPTEDLAEEYVLAQTSRYLSGLDHIDDRQSTISTQRMTEHELHAILRMSRRSFDRLLTVIADHSVFQSRSNRKQEPVAV